MSLDFDPTVINWLSSPTPMFSSNQNWQTVDANEFYITIGSDHDSFDYWQTAVITTLYDVSENFEPNAID